MRKSSKIAGTLVLVGSTALGVGCSGAPDAGSGSLLTDALQADGAYMRAQLRAHGERGRVKIDLADDRQFHFLTARMAASGVTADTAPQLFAGLLETRKRLLAAGPGTLHPTAGQGATNPPRCDVFIIPETLDQNEFTTLSRVSCVDGAVYNYVDTYQFDEDDNALAYDFIETWNQGIVDDMELTSVPPSNKAVWADGITYTETGTTVESYYYVTAYYDNHTDTGRTVRGTLTAPVDVNKNGVIRYCLDRGASSADCDYKHGSTSPCNGNFICEQNSPDFPVLPPPFNGNLLYMPMEGYTASSVPNTPGNPYVLKRATAWLTLRNAGSTTPPGGFCAKDLTDSGIFRLETFGGRQRVIIDPSAPALGNANWPDHCIDNGRSVDLNIEAQYYQPDCSFGVCPVTTVAWTTLPSPGNPSAPPMQIYWGCLASGTAITLADGSKLPIEQIAAGQKVLSDEQGRALTVVDIVEGAERKPMIRVVDDRGHVVTMSSTHAMPIGDGKIVQAESLRIGDRIATKDGPATIVAVDRPEMESAVYNLVLGTEEELAEVGPEGTTMFADGVQVGDNRMQTLAAEQAQADELAARGGPVSAALRVDYERSMERMARRAAR